MPTWSLRNLLVTRARKIGIVGAALGVAFLCLNVLAYSHAWAMTHFKRGGVRTGKPETLSWTQKAGVVFMGVQLPRPVNDITPADHGMAFQTWMIPENDGTTLEAWDIPIPARRGVVVLFHGYADRKASVLSEAKAFRDLGWEAVVVDHRGSGGSTGDVTSIGYHEARDDLAAVRFVRQRMPDDKVILWGVSMGGAAALRAVGELDARVDALIVEAPFSTLRSAIVNRFHAFHIPTYGLVDLFLFWGGVQQSFNGFKHNPVDYARTVHVPTLFLLGARDERVLQPEGRAVFDALAGEKHFELFDGLGHQSLLRGQRDHWMKIVGEFLDRFPIQTSSAAKPTA